MNRIPATLDRSRIEALVPHAGAMCLLDRVERWDARTIACRTATHRDAANPLRLGDRLPIETGIEYAAQAMAVHGGLSEAGESPRRGYVAVLSGVSWTGDRLDDEPGELLVTAWSLQAGDGGRQYGFRVEGADGGIRLEGEALVVLEDRED